MDRRAFFFGLASAVSIPSIKAMASGWSPGNRHVTVIIPFSPGGGTDVVFRSMQGYGSRRGINFVAEYRSGAEGLIGMRHGASSPPDGLHLTLGTTGTMAHMVDGFSAVDSFDQITGLRSGAYFFITGMNSGITSMPELIRMLRDPSVRITGGSGAPGQRMVIDSFLRAAGVSNAFIANYRGAAGVMQDVAGNHVQWGAVPGSVAASLANSGQILVLATDLRPGDPVMLPGVPSIFDFVPHFQKNDMHLVALPRNSNPQIRDFWEGWFRTYLSDPSVVSEIESEYSVRVPFGRETVLDAVTKWRQSSGS